MEAKQNQQGQASHALISIDVFNELSNYVTKQPYQDVFQLIEKMKGDVKLINLPPEEKEQPPKEPKEPKEQVEPDGPKKVKRSK